MSNAALPGPNCPVVRTTGQTAIRDTCPFRKTPLIDVVFTIGSWQTREVSRWLPVIQKTYETGDCRAYNSGSCHYPKMVERMLFDLKEFKQNSRLQQLSKAFPMPTIDFLSGSEFAKWAAGQQAYSNFLELELSFEENANKESSSLFCPCPYGDFGYWNKARAYYLYDKILKGEGNNITVQRLLRLCCAGSTDKRNFGDDPTSRNLIKESYGIEIARDALNDLLSQGVLMNLPDLIKTALGYEGMTEVPLIVGE